MIEVRVDDRLGKKVFVKCNEDDTIGDLKKLLAAQLGTKPEKIRCVCTRTAPAHFSGAFLRYRHFYLCSAFLKLLRRLQKWYTVFKDHITLADYEIHDGSNLELYYC